MVNPQPISTRLHVGAVRGRIRTDELTGTGDRSVHEGCTKLMNTVISPPGASDSAHAAGGAKRRLPASATSGEQQAKRSRPEPTANAAPQELRVGSKVFITGLLSASGQAMNGKRGTVFTFDEAKGRYAVQVDDAFAPVLLKPTNLWLQPDAGSENASGGGASAPALLSQSPMLLPPLPFDGDVEAAQRAGDRQAILQIFAERQSHERGDGGSGAGGGAGAGGCASGGEAEAIPAAKGHNAATEEEGGQSAGERAAAAPAAEQPEGEAAPASDSDDDVVVLDEPGGGGELNGKGGDDDDNNNDDDDDDDDDEVKITSEGVNALADFPHTRPDCVVKVGAPPDCTATH